MAYEKKKKRTNYYVYLESDRVTNIEVKLNPEIGKASIMKMKRSLCHETITSDCCDHSHMCLFMTYLDQQRGNNSSRFSRKSLRIIFIIFTTELKIAFLVCLTKKRYDDYMASVRSKYFCDLSLYFEIT